MTDILDNPHVYPEGTPTYVDGVPLYYEGPAKLPSITVFKPEGSTMGVLKNTAEGIHSQFSDFYFREKMRLEEEIAFISAQIDVPIKLTDPRAAPLRAHATDAGADLYSITSAIIRPGDMKLVDTGVAVKIPKGYVGLVFNRSSQGKVEVVIANGTGVIDSDYRGNILVRLKNNGPEHYIIKEFETRIAQLVIVPIALPEFTICTDEDEWLDTERGEGGFGSTDSQ